MGARGRAVLRCSLCEQCFVLGANGGIPAQPPEMLPHLQCTSDSLLSCSTQNVTHKFTVLCRLL